jgi:hypothetical protein
MIWETGGGEFPCEGSDYDWSVYFWAYEAISVDGGSAPAGLTVVPV